MARSETLVLRLRYEGGRFKPLEPVELREGEEVVAVIRRGGVAQRLYGAAKRRRPGVTREELLRVIEELEDGGPA